MTATPAHLEADGDGILVFPASAQQQWLWRQIQSERAAGRDPGGRYNVPVAVRIGGTIDTSLVEQCFAEISQRHEILRTAFHEVDSAVLQVVSPRQPIPFARISVATTPAHEREARALQAAETAARQPFDVETGPLIRVDLVGLGEKDHLLVATMHHLICDAWSTRVLLHELAALYSARIEGKKSALNPLAIQYADYAVWQERQLENDGFRRHLSYWKERLGGSRTSPGRGSGPSPYSRDGEPGPDATLPPRRQSGRLPPWLSEGVKKLNQRSGASLFMTLLTALKVLLHHHTGQSHISVGSPVANRPAETEALIGFFTNVIVLDTDLSGNLSFAELLARVRRDTLSAYAHQDVPFGTVMSEVHPDGPQRYQTLFRVLFTLHNVPLQLPQIPQFDWQVVVLDVAAMEFDMTLDIKEEDDQIAFTFAFDRAKFSDDDIARAVGASPYRQLVEAIVRHPDHSIAELWPFSKS